MPGSRIDLSVALHRPLTGGGVGVGETAFGEDAAGNLYYVELDGTLFKITSTVPEPRAYIAAVIASTMVILRRRRERFSYLGNWKNDANAPDRPNLQKHRQYPRVNLTRRKSGPHSSNSVSMNSN